MLNRLITIAGILILVGCNTAETEVSRTTLADSIDHSIRTELLNKWYPAVIDSVHGGYLTTFLYDFTPGEQQDKMIVTQARHMWTCSKAAIDYPADGTLYEKTAEHGFRFLRDVMWDKKYGGFVELTDRQGNVNSDHKTAYGNAFAIYGLAAYYMAFKDTAALGLAKKAFMWLEKNSHDPQHKGYFQHLNNDGSVMERPPFTPSTAVIGYKDQNSSIHLLEAFTELYQVWPDSLVHERLVEMIALIRDTIVNEKGNLVLFLTPDWKPISFRDSTEEVILKHRGTDHVSFGHDVETAYLLMEASHVAGIRNDKRTWEVAKLMVDQALNNGWDSIAGGFFDEGYYFKDKPSITIIRDTKNWWAQAEGLNTLLIMADLYPDDPLNYYEKFTMMWRYIDKHLIDHQFGEWYQGGLDKEPDQREKLKGHIWKASYHQYRSLSNCVKRLRQGGDARHDAI